MADRKTQIIDTAANLLQSRSYSSFSYQDLSDALGIRKASIHHHFKTKEDLGIGLAEHFRRQYGTRLEEISRFYENPWDLFEAYLAITSDIMLTADRICAAGVFQAEHNVVPGIHVVQPDVEEALTRFHEGYRMIAYSLDITMLARACRSGLSDLRGKLAASQD